MLNRSCLQSTKGQSMLEVMIASTVGILVVAALAFTTLFSLRDANFAKTSAQATKLAQEGIERVRMGRDRNQCIIPTINLTGVNSWNGDNTTCPGGSIWDKQISGIGFCDDPDSGGKCYFNVGSEGVSEGVLNNIDFGQTTFPTSAESIAPNFKRVVLLSDDSTSYTAQKTVTVIVNWTDTTGPHESRLVTILRKK